MDFDRKGLEGEIMPKVAPFCKGLGLILFMFAKLILPEYS